MKNLINYIIDGDVDNVKKSMEDGVDVDVLVNTGMADVGLLSARLDEVSPLYVAVYCGHYSVVKMMLEHGADVNIKNSIGETSLLWAVNCQRTDLVKLLLEHDANANIRDIYLRSPLGTASNYKNTEIVRLLLSQKGIKVNLKDEDGDTPLHSACINFRLKTVKLLLDNHAKANIRNKEKETPIDIAKKHNDIKMIKLLNDHVAKNHV